MMIGGAGLGDPWAGERFPEEDLVASPIGRTAPMDGLPGWNWVRPCGATPVPELMAWWIRALYRTPFLDRCVHQLIWVRGGFLVL
jgi:hypothetical protein